MSKPKTLSIIGCGKVGQTLSRLWVQHQTVQIQDILNTSMESGARAAAFIGTGRVASQQTSSSSQRQTIRSLPAV